MQNEASVICILAAGQKMKENRNVFKRNAM